MKQTLVVKLHVYRQIPGRTGILRNEKGQIENINQTVSLTHDTLEWYNYLKSINPVIFAKVEVESCHQLISGTYQVIECPEEIQKEVAATMKTADKPLTEDQKKIAALEAKIEAMTKAAEPVKVDSTELEAKRREYKDITSKKAHHSWDVDAIQSKIEEYKEQNP